MISEAPVLSRRNLLLAGGAVGAMLIASCGSPSGGGGGNAKTLTGASWADGVNDLVFGSIKSNFAKASGLTVNPQAAVPFSDYQTRFRTLIAGGSPPDLMRLNDDFLREMSDKKTILDIDSYVKKDNIDTSGYFENVFDFTALPNGRAGLALGTAPRVMFYNKSLFRERGVPLPPTTWSSKDWTWDDFLETAKALTTNDVWGTVVVKDTAFENIWSTNNGGDGIFSQDGKKFALADSEGIEALQWAADLSLVHKVAPPWADIAAEQAELQLFAAGRSAMLLYPMSGVSYLEKNIKNFEWDIAPIPARVNQYTEGSMIVMVIPAKAKNPDGAWEFLKYITGPDGGKAFAENRICVPLNRKAAESIVPGAGGPANVQLFAEAAAHNRNVFSTTATAAAVAIYRPKLQQALIGEITVEEALSSSRAQVEAALA
ncbi:sugar ABC transporter substrate-binding protein [Pseudarthrobacter sp. MDT3-28]|uniref:ABC transporter substrate-binding protein n=1 Tax=Pseudarthrobacter raffinosi TaxID=2953651 RepID=UPI00208F2954|nr:sugar ABC transporter substrate-binding protein [Pseudarthrobacter sp. MDT3-28]MCO4239623.1 sugar ABC transporter substrate-binding protein [Pseudarthrobacter sp. MDT3-28]